MDAVCWHENRAKKKLKSGCGCGRGVQLKGISWGLGGSLTQNLEQKSACYLTFPKHTVRFAKCTILLLVKNRSFYFQIIDPPGGPQFKKNEIDIR